jgi:Glycosyl hydrolase family 26
MSTARLPTAFLAALMAVALWATAALGTAGAAKAKLTIATSAPLSGQRVSGWVTWRGKVTGAAPRRVVFALDGKVAWSQKAAPYLYGGARNAFDTARLANGAHSLSATAYGPKGAKAATRITVIVANPVGLPATQASPAATPDAPAQAPVPGLSPAPESEPTPAPAPGQTRLPIYWGATIGSQLTGSQAPWDMTAVTKFEELAQKPVSLVQFFQPFENCASTPCSAYPFPKTPLENIRRHGAIPVLSWASESTPASVNQPAFQLADVIGGRYDSFIRSFAYAAREWGHPFLLRFNWEMNGSWFPWSESVNGNRPGEYVTAWRHVHDIFTSVGATNATWSWCPNIDPAHSMQSLESLYPGDEYVDWTGLDGYNWGTNPTKPAGWRTFDQLYSSTYREITGSIAPSKPMLIGEIGSSEDGGSKAAWISDTLGRIPTDYPKIRALIWFDKLDGGMDWPIETSSAATAAFANGVRASSYLGGSFAGLTAAKITPFGSGSV